MEEAKHYVAQANAELDKKGGFVDEFVICRHAGEVMMAPRENVDLMDVSPKQLVSVAAALIPFLENDDANRALMGSNMQRQAVPLVRAEAPFVGTGMEPIVARDFGAAIGARRGGVVDQVDATRIVIRATEDLDPGKSGVDIYRLMKFQRSNQNTCINQRPLVQRGRPDRTRATSSPTVRRPISAIWRSAATCSSRSCRGTATTTRTSILLSERIVADDVFTSIHIEEFEVMARDTKLGPEEITRDIPNVSEEALKNLDEAGIVYIGAEVQPGDILVGKITPKGESPMTPEEKLLRAIFGEKASDVRDTSMRMPPGHLRHGRRSARLQPPRRREGRARHGDRARGDRASRQGPRRRAGDPRPQRLQPSVRHADRQGGDRRSEGLQEGHQARQATSLDDYPRSQWWQFAVENEKLQGELEALRGQYDDSKKALEQRFMDKVEKVQRGDEMPPGVMKMVKVFVAVKRKMQPGDKMAGRHGNKGVVSRIVPVEDMPFLEDGTHVDIVLNPLGVPIAHECRPDPGDASGLGLRRHGQEDRRADRRLQGGRRHQAAAQDDRGSDPGQRPQRAGPRSYDDESVVRLGEQMRRGVSIATPVFDGAHEADINEMLERGGPAHQRPVDAL